MRNRNGKLSAAFTAVLLGSAAWTPLLAKPPLRAITAGIVDPVSDTITPYYRNIDPFYRNIGAFWGDINPFYRNIGAFWGDVNPFYRNIGAFWGDINPLYRNIGAFNGQIFPDYRNIGAFWDSAGQTWSGIDQAWGAAGTYASNPTGYAALRDQVAQLSATSEAMWGAAVQSQTGKSFTDAFAAPLFAKYHIDLSNPASLEGLSPSDRSHFFLDWYDGLMNYSGTDHVDWWMKTINWTPALTQTQTQNQGPGQGVTIGLVDFFVAGDDDIKSKTIYNGGVSTFSNGHGAGVASLMVASHDGKGIMGIAPKAAVAAYNPFDSSGTADWPDIINGIKAVTGAGASVVNLSLGVPGWTMNPDWRSVFTDSGVSAVQGRTVYVIAAGNDGVTQAQNFSWTGAVTAVATPSVKGAAPTQPAAPVAPVLTGSAAKAAQDAGSGTSFILVGSVDPTGTISDFSNRPGEACILDAGGKKCDISLKDRFIVAPGELILVSDDNGGLVRRSGTSFAAPLVSGAIALLQDRWPWLKNYPAETSQIILSSAKDLGAPGNDPVYGVGLLDVTASQSPLDFNKLTFYQVNGLIPTTISASNVKKAGVVGSWEAAGLYFAAFEKIGATQRDFEIPLSSRLVGLTAPNGERFQDYIYSRLTSWIQTGKFSDMRQQTALLPNSLGLNLTMTAGAVNPTALRYTQNGRVLQSSLHLDAPSGRFGFTVGQGDGAIALGRQNGFGMFSDYASDTGGVNPILGFASGGAYAAANVAINPDLTLSVGTSERQRGRHMDLLGVQTALDRAAFAGLDDYRAKAANVVIDYRLSPDVKVQVSYTGLNENGLLGIRSIEASDIQGGSRSDAVTLGGDVSVGGGFQLSASATAATTHSANGSAALTATGVMSSSYQLALVKDRVLGKSDHLRLSFAQPMTVERGSIDYKSVQVVDRQTGDLGVVTQRIDAAGVSRRFVGEAIYSMALFGGRSELSAFGRGELGDLQNDEARYTMGGRWSFSF